jgi:hypothetical protein
MNRFGIIAVFACALALTAASLPAESVVAGTAGNPYSAIVARNVFGLNPPASPPDPEVAAETDLPKITVNGVISGFGDLTVLFQTTESKGGKCLYYVLDQGQHEDDIEVLRIDEKSGIVKFSNHGVQQNIALANEPDVATNPSVRTPKPGDVDYVNQQSVTAGLNENHVPAAEAQRMPYQSRVDQPQNIVLPIVATSMTNGGGDSDGNTPPGHGGSPAP